MGDFRKFLLLEQEEFLGQKLGDVLTALHSLTVDSPNSSNRQQLDIAQGAVREMQRILQGRWSNEEMPHLKAIQKAATALAVAIDSNEKMPEVIAAVTAELERLQSKMGMPVNNIQPPEPPKGSMQEV